MGYCWGGLAAPATSASCLRGRSGWPGRHAPASPAQPVSHLQSPRLHPDLHLRNPLSFQCYFWHQFWASATGTAPATRCCWLSEGRRHEPGLPLQTRALQRRNGSGPRIPRVTRSDAVCNGRCRQAARWRSARRGRELEICLSAEQQESLRLRTCSSTLSAATGRSVQCRVHGYPRTNTFAATLQSESVPVGDVSQGNAALTTVERGAACARLWRRCRACRRPAGHGTSLESVCSESPSSQAVKRWCTHDQRGDGTRHRRQEAMAETGMYVAAKSYAAVTVPPPADTFCAHDSQSEALTRNCNRQLQCTETDGNAGTHHRPGHRCHEAQHARTGACSPGSTVPGRLMHLVQRRRSGGTTPGNRKNAGLVCTAHKRMHMQGACCQCELTQSRFLGPRAHGFLKLARAGCEADFANKNSESGLTPDPHGHRSQHS